MSLYNRSFGREYGAISQANLAVMTRGLGIRMLVPAGPHAYNPCSSRNRGSKELKLSLEGPTAQPAAARRRNAADNVTWLLLLPSASFFFFSLSGVIWCKKARTWRRNPAREIFQIYEYQDISPKARRQPVDPNHGFHLHFDHRVITSFNNKFYYYNYNGVHPSSRPGRTTPCTAVEVQVSQRKHT